MVEWFVHPSIVLSGGVILLTWPTSATGFSLQSTRVLGPSAVWTSVSPGLVIGGENIVAIIPSGTQQFFKLGQLCLRSATIFNLQRLLALDDSIWLVGT
jgi:hypothetical protein